MSDAHGGTNVVRYGAAALADILPSALAALGVPGEPNVLELEPAQSIVVLLVDGLGWNLLRRNAAIAPFLGSLAGRPLTAGFPTTTATSLASLGTGLPPGQHGITGYTSRVGDLPDPVNWLRWQTTHSGRNLIDELVPEQVQPRPTVLERAQRAGVDVSVVTSYAFRGTGLTRAVLRGGTFVPVLTSADTVISAAAAALGRPSLVYCYTGDLDLIGHGRGTASDAWCVQLALLDRMIEMLAHRLPPGTRLLVVADHGMVDMPEDDKIDYDGEPLLSQDVVMLAGEARVRYVHVRPGSVEDVRARWQSVLGDRMAVLTRDEAIARGWYGPSVAEPVRERIGDLVVVSTSRAGIVRRRVEPRMSEMRGQHGALTEDELLVPLLSTP